MSKLRVGFVGSGEVTQLLHLPALNQLREQFTVTALCDVSPATLANVADHWRIPHRTDDYRALVALEEVDVVVVANPNAYHAAVALAALQAGKHVMIEKPMCMTLREADEIIAATAASDRIVQVGYMRRYAPAFGEACALVKKLGQIKLARVHDVLGSNSLFSQNTNWIERAGDTPAAILAEGRALNDALITEAVGDVTPDLRNAYGLLLGLSSHDISAMRELLGRPRRVLYAAARAGGLYLSAAFDYGDFVCQFETGTDNIARFDGHLEVFSANQVIRVQYDTPYVRNLPIRLTVTEANGRGGVSERVENPVWGDPFVAEWQAFHANVMGGLSPKTTPADFRQDLELFQQMIVCMQR
jgi:predicted dehydrogenase